MRHWSRSRRPLAQLLGTVLAALGLLTLALALGLLRSGAPALAQRGPPPVVLTSPSNGATGQSPTLTFSWQASSGATLYNLYVYDPAAPAASGTGLGAGAINTGVTTTSYSVPAGTLVPGHLYWWEVFPCTTSPSTSCNYSGQTVWAFTTTGAAAAFATLSSPSDGAANTGTTPTLSWTAPSDAISGTTTYTVLLYDPTANSNQGGFLQNLPATTSTSVAVPSSANLQYGRGYYWNVDACTSGNCSGPASHYFALTTAPAPGNVTLTTPANTATGVSTTPTLSWTAAPNAGSTTTYTAALWDPYGDPGGHLLGSLPAVPYTTTSVSVPAAEGLYSGQAYQWSVTACTGLACSAPAWFTFTTAAQPAATLSGAGPTEILNPDFSGVTAGATSVHGWSAASGYSFPSVQTDASGFNYLQLDNASRYLVTATPLALDYASGGYSVFRLGYRSASGSLALYANSSTVWTASPSSGWSEALVALPSAYGASVTLGLSGYSADVAYLQRLDGPAGRGNTAAGLASGGFASSSTDLALGGLGSIGFARSYSTQAATASFPSGGSATPGPLGSKWTDNWQFSVQAGPISGSILLRTPGGGATLFLLQSGTTYVGPAGVHSTLVTGTTSWTLTTPDQHVLSFPAPARTGDRSSLSSITDRNGTTTTLAYDSSGNLTTVTAPSGRSITLHYGSNGLVISLSDSAGRSVSYSYTNGDLTGVTDVRGNTTTYSYTGHRMSQIIDPVGNASVRTTYDSSNRLATSLDAAGDTTTYQYATPGAGATTVLDGRGKATVTYFDAGMRITDQIDASGNDVASSWDAANNVMTVSGPLGTGKRQSYDIAGNLLSVTDADNYTTTSTYDSMNNPLVVTDAMGHQTVATYDSHGNLHTLTTADGTTSYTVNGKGQVTAVLDARGNSTGAGYDATTGDATSATDALGHTSTTTFDAVGRPLQITDPLGHSATKTYDAAGNVLTVTSHAGMTALVTTNSYDLDGRLHTSQDANGHTTTYAYDSSGRLHAVTDANGGVTTFGYDAAGNRVSVQDANGKTTSYSFDDDERPLTVTDPKTNVLYTLSYDAAGRVATRTDARGAVATYGYSPRSELVSLSYSGVGASSTPNVSYQYDALGNRLSMTDGTGTTSYQYDALSRPTSITYPGSKTVSYTYDAVGHRASTSYPGGGSKVVQYSYDQDERLSSVTDWNSQTTSYQYDAASRMTATTLPSSTGVTSAFVYDESNRLTSVTHSKGGSTLFSASYTLDNAGNRTQQVTSGSAALAAGTQSYSLDVLNRLHTASYPSGMSQTYTYDAVGNRQSLVVTGGSNPGTTTYSYESAQQSRIHPGGAIPLPQRASHPAGSESCAAGGNECGEA